MVHVRELDETLNAISDLNMAQFYRSEFALWRGGELRLLNSGGGCGNVARFAKARGFVSESRRKKVAIPPLSSKGCDLLGMEGWENRDRWQTLVEALKEMRV